MKSQSYRIGHRSFSNFLFTSINFSIDLIIGKTTEQMTGHRPVLRGPIISFVILDLFTSSDTRTRGSL